MKLTAIILFSFGALSLQAVDVTVTHPNGTTTTYSSAVNTDASRGLALLSAVSNGVAGDKLALAAKVFDLGPTNTLALNAVSPGLSLSGSGTNNTEIKTQCDFNSVGTPFISVGNASVVNDLKITDAGGVGVFSFPIGIFHGPAALNVVLSNLVISGQSDCIYMFTTN